jgi:hypothetical protein
MGTLFPKMAYLALEDNPLESLPASIGQLSFLGALAVSRGRLTALPRELANCTALAALHADGNRLTELPEEFTTLTRLTHLTLGFNRLAALPRGLLDNLELVDLSNNQVSSLAAVLPLATVGAPTSSVTTHAKKAVEIILGRNPVCLRNYSSGSGRSGGSGGSGGSGVGGTDSGSGWLYSPPPWVEAGGEKVPDYDASRWNVTCASACRPGCVYACCLQAKLKYAEVHYDGGGTHWTMT